jgi:hypothetical protein
MSCCFRRSASPQRQRIQKYYFEHCRSSNKPSGIEAVLARL